MFEKQSVMVLGTVLVAFSERPGDAATAVEVLLAFTLGSASGVSNTRGITAIN